MRTINYKVSYESLISRLPALFAYIERNERGEIEIVKATKGKQGCYGKIVANINECPPLTHTCKDGTVLKITGNKPCSYRTLIDTYYKAKNDGFNYEDKDFKDFVEYAIGLVYVGLSEEETNDTDCGVTITKKFPLAPDYIYLGEAKTFYNRMVKMKKQINFWENHIKSCKDDEKYYEAIKAEFELMNGDKLMTKLIELISKADEIAEEMNGKATLEDFYLNFNVNLANTIKDLGLVTPHIQEWVAGNRYYNEDAVYYVDDNGFGMTWKCNLTKGNDDVKEDDNGRLYTEGHYDDETELIYFDRDNWEVQTLNWVELWKCKKCSKIWHSKTEPIGKCDCWEKDEKEAYTQLVTETENTINGACNSHLVSLRRFETYLNMKDEPELPSKYEDWLWYYRVGNISNREEVYDEMGNLGVLYGDDFAEGVEAIANSEVEIGENIKLDGDGYVFNLAAWGDIIENIEAKNNEVSGIGTITFTYWLGAHLKAKKDDSDEKQWYSVDDDGNYKYYFKDFEIDKESVYGKNCGVKYTESYIYYQGNTEMKVTRDFSEEYVNDDTENEKNIVLTINYNSVVITLEKAPSETEKSKKTYDFKKGDIISYDTYLSLDDNSEENKKNCEPREYSIWSLVEFDKTFPQFGSDGMFKWYINGWLDKDSTKVEDHKDLRLYDKMEFDSSNNVYTYDVKIGNRFNKVEYVKANYETNVDITHVDVEETPLIRYDYYNGVSFQPSVNQDVYIERGITQAFEKHIKFSEIKTFEDFENYANGGFFVISKEDINLG